MNENKEANEYGVSQYGRWLIQLRNGEKPRLNQTNNYLFEAVRLTGLLYTLPEIKKEYPNIFENPPLPLVLEIGCYLGHNVVELAGNNPGINVLGIDIKFKRVVKSCDKIKKEGVTNAKIALCDIRDLMAVLPEKSVFGMCIFFPDPWIKGRHKKFRYLIEEFFEDAFSKLTDDGFIWLKTDHKDYYEDALGYAQQLNYEVIDRLPGKVAQREYKTVFENIFIEQDLPVYRLMVKKSII